MLADQDSSASLLPIVVLADWYYPTVGYPSRFRPVFAPTGFESLSGQGITSASNYPPTFKSTTAGTGTVTFPEIA